MPIADKRVLLVDLNNFARYPTIPIGLLTAVLRRARASVRLYAPLMVGVRGVVREPRLHRFSLLLARLNYRVAVSRRPWLREARERFAGRRRSGITAHEQRVVQGFRDELARGGRPDVVLVSTYLFYRGVCETLCAICREQGIPVLVGGPYFAQPDVVADWLRIPGLSALAAGEIELRLPQVLATLLEGGDASVHEGVFVPTPDGRGSGRIARPLQALDEVPFPDYSDFPWAAYPNRIVPVVTGRGCGWGACSFCSDVTSTAGRTYRSRSPGNVLEELRGHHAAHEVSRFVFTDLKLNSDLGMWRSLIGGMQSVVPGAQWIGAVHVGRGRDNGLGAADLRAAAASGCVRLTTGLETGSQRLADAMKKGTRIERVAAYLDDAASAGISCRCTMILGHPGETADDVHASANFLERHGRAIERVSLNRLQLITGTVLHRQASRQPGRFAGFDIVSHDVAQAQSRHRHAESERRAHRQAAMRLFAAVHRINARPLSARARDFEGVM